MHLYPSNNTRTSKELHCVCPLVRAARRWSSNFMVVGDEGAGELEGRGGRMLRRLAGRVRGSSPSRLWHVGGARRGGSQYAPTAEVLARRWPVWLRWQRRIRCYWPCPGRWPPDPVLLAVPRPVAAGSGGDGRVRGLWRPDRCGIRAGGGGGGGAATGWRRRRGDAGLEEEEAGWRHPGGGWGGAARAVRRRGRGGAGLEEE